MAKNYFLTDNKQELTRVAQEITVWFKEKQYKVESKSIDGQIFIQAAKTGAIRTLIGSNLAFKVWIYWSTDNINKQELIVETSVGKWVQNIAGAGFTSLFLGGIPIFIGMANAGWALILENSLVSFLETDLKLKKVKTNETNETVGYPENMEPLTISVNVNPSGNSDPREKAKMKAQEDLKKLEEAFNCGIITESEFKQKKSHLDAKLEEYEADFLAEEKITKLSKAFEDGILDAEEYESKIKDIYDSIHHEIAERKKKKEQEKKAKMIAKLKEALENGIITEEEYLSKLEQL
jgi:ribosomal protein S20